MKQRIYVEKWEGSKSDFVWYINNYNYKNRRDAKELIDFVIVPPYDSSSYWSYNIEAFIKYRRNMAEYKRLTKRMCEIESLLDELRKFQKKHKIHYLTRFINWQRGRIYYDSPNFNPDGAMDFETLKCYYEPDNGYGSIENVVPYVGKKAAPWLEKFITEKIRKEEKNGN